MLKKISRMLRKRYGTHLDKIADLLAHEKAPTVAALAATILLLGIPFVLWATWLVILLVHHGLTETFFCFYASVSAGFFLYFGPFISFVSRKGRKKNPVLRILEVRGKLPDVENRWEKLRVWSAQLCRDWSKHLCWPMENDRVSKQISEVAKNPTLVKRLTHDDPKGDIPDYAVFRLAFSFAILILSAPSSPYRGALSAIVLAAIGLEHLAFVIAAGDGLPSLLKQTMGSPVVKLLLLLCCDFTTLTLSISILVSRGAPRVAIIHHLQEIAAQLVSAPKTVGVIAAFGLKGGVAALTGLPHGSQLALFFGLLMYGALLRTAVNNGLSSLKRTDDDYLALGRRLSFLGKIDAGLAMISKIKHPTCESERARVYAFLSAGKVDQAKAAASRQIRLDPEVLTEPETEDVYFEMFFLWWGLLPPEARLKLRDFAHREALSASARLCFNLMVAESEFLEFGKVVTTEAIFESEFLSLLNLIAAGSANMHEQALLKIEGIQAPTECDVFVKCFLECLLQVRSLGNAEAVRKTFDAWLEGWPRLCDDSGRPILHKRIWTQFLAMELCQISERLTANQHHEGFALWLAKLQRETLDEFGKSSIGRLTMQHAKLDMKLNGIDEGVATARSVS